jgi:hypothetical protein
MKPLVLAALTAIAVALGSGCVLLRPPSASERPRWRLTAPSDYAHDCIVGRAFVRKSGKTGVGMTLELRSRGDCAVTIARAELVLASGRRVPAGIRAVPPLAGRSLVYTWLAFPFDNNAAWNRGDRDGVFELDLAIAGAPAPATTWRIPARHAF